MVAIDRAPTTQVVDHHLAKLRERKLEPAWIVLGASDWLEFRRELSRSLDSMLAYMNGEKPATYRGVPIAVTSADRWCEVVPKVP